MHRTAADLDSTYLLRSSLNDPFEHFPIGVYRTAPDGTLIYANRALEEMLRSPSLEDLFQRSATTAYPDPSTREKWLEVIEREGKATQEVQLRRYDGTLIWVLDSAMAIRDSGGNTLCYEGALRDITQRKEAEERLEEERSYFTHLFEGAPEAIAMLDDEDVVLRINSQFTQLFGYSGVETVGRNINELIVPRELDEEGRNLSDQVHRGQTINAQSLRRTKDGRLVPVSVLATPFTAPHGEATVYAVYRDTTEQTRALEALEKTRKRFQSMIENSSDMISIFDLEGRRTYVSPSMSRTLGQEEDELLHQSVLDTVHPEDRAAAADFVAWLAQHPGEMRSIEFRRKRKDGEWRLLSAVGKNLVNDPSVAGIVVNARDITEERVLAEQVRRSHKMEAVGRLAGGIAHDFNNLLTVIASCTDFILGDPTLADEHRADLTEVKKATDRATSLTRQLLAFGRTQVLRPSTINLNDRLEELLPMLKRLFETTIDISIERAPDLWAVRADPGQIEQVLLNLALNARDAMPEGGALTFVTENCVVVAERAGLDQEYTMKPGDYVLLRVRDTGVGMDEDTQRKIFEPFFTTKEVGKGTGLGLATAYGIVKQSGGYIKVRSAPEHGSEFLIYLLRTDAAPDKIVPREHRDDFPTSGKVLVVEDEAAVRQVLQRMLIAEGYTVVTAANGAEALELFAARKDEVDLLITDIVMPEMGGRELARQCCNLRQRLKVIYLSGYTKDSLLSQQTFEEGTEFIEKPFTRDAILERIARVFRS